MAWLDDHPPARSQFRCPRRADPSGLVVVHTAENAPDTTGADSGAENVANFIRGRSDPGSYHDLCDSDSVIQLVRYDCEAFHDGTGSNSHSYGVSGATQAVKWASLPQGWRDSCVHNMAVAASRYAHWLHQRWGIVIPARRVTRSTSELRVPGFISHAERDPERRTDPGAGFPWSQFLDEFARLTDQQEEDDVTLSLKQVAQLDKIERRLDVVYNAYRMQGQEWSGNLPGRVDALYTTRDVDVDALAAAIVAQLPDDGIDQATVEAGVRAVFADAADA